MTQAAKLHRSGLQEGEDIADDNALFQSLRNWMSPHIRLIELDLHINDPAFAETAVGTLLEMLKS